MKKIYMLSALLCASVFSFTSCIEETFENPVPANDGDEIIFGARAGFEGGGAATKTIYSGEIYELNGKKFERIDWLDEQDAIQIYCPQAEGPNPSHYTVYHAKDHDTQKDYAYLAKNGDSALQWNGDGEHHFYAMYPSSSIFTGDQSTLASGITMDGTVLRGTVPGAQAPISIEQDGNNWIAKPNMKFAYMAARSTATREAGNVSLTFVPIVTAVQIQLTLAKGSIDPVSIAEIQVQGNGIAGDFSADLSETAWTGTYPTCVNEGAGTGIVQVSMWKDSNPITLEAGQSLTFTVFLRPGAEYSNLKVSYSPTGSGYLGKTMGSANDLVVIKKNIKTVITGFNLPARFDEEEDQITVDASKWMTQVADEIDFKKLSIPGTGGSFSFNYTADTDGYFRSQHTHMTIAEQWKVGIRAFEIVSDRIESGGFLGWGASPASLAGTPVTCNKNSVGINVGAALEQINNQLNANPQECAVVIFTYQPEGAVPDRNATKYAQSLKLWFDGISYKDKFVLYRPDITLGQVRGKILVIVRLNQDDEKDSGSFSDAVGQLPVGTYPFLLVDGCGTAKDKWGARGYIVDGSPALNISNSAGDGVTYIEQYMESATIDPSNHSNVRRGSMNFAYKTNTDADCWYHEWARVLPDNLYNASGRQGLGLSYQAMYWFESYSEKLSNAVETFKMAISDEYNQYVFVNTLSGYMATEATKGSPTYSLVPSVGSVYGGDGGDIDSLATRLNSDFYREVLSAGMEQTTGPTGIVMMDYVTNTPTEGVEYDGSYYLPGVIIANNFKHGSGNGSNTGGGNQGDQGNQGEGDNDTPGDEGDGF